jgi:hypothetical protein
MVCCPHAWWCRTHAWCAICTPRLFACLHDMVCRICCCVSCTVWARLSEKPQQSWLSLQCAGVTERAVDWGMHSHTVALQRAGADAEALLSCRRPALCALEHERSRTFGWVPASAGLTLCRQLFGVCSVFRSDDLPQGVSVYAVLALCCLFSKCAHFFSQRLQATQPLHA